MKIGLISDMHLLSKTPNHRIDNILQTQWDKVEFILNTCKLNGVEFLFQAGDMFDVPRNWDVLGHAIKLYSEYFASTGFYSVLGQHDVYMRNEKTITNIQILKEIGLVHTTYPDNKLASMNGVAVYGINWMDTGSIDDLVDSIQVSKHEFNILVIHAGISDAPIFPGHEFSNASTFLKKHTKFNVILCGDIHKDFYIRNKDRFILNTGCMIRKNRDDHNSTYQPHFYILEISPKLKFINLIKYEIPCRIFEDVFDQSLSFDSEEFLTNFVESISSPVYTNVNIYESIDRFIKDNNINSLITKIISEVMADDNR
jgi:DNA repair exonuclease SbcCD nuclease subunit